jgi:hypothetical protein
MDWDEFVAGHRAGLIEWNTARLSPGRGGQGSARRRRELDLPLSRIVAAYPLSWFQTGSPLLKAPQVSANHTFETVHRLPSDVDATPFVLCEDLETLDLRTVGGSLSSQRENFKSE